MTQQALMDHFKKNDAKYELSSEILSLQKENIDTLLLIIIKPYILGAPEFLIDRNDPILKTVEEYSELGACLDARRRMCFY